MLLVANLDLNGNQLLNARMQVLTADPASPVDGQMWYRSDLFEVRHRVNGVTRTVAYLTTRLDQFAAPTAAVPFNGQKITGIGAATAGTDAASLANRLDQFAVPTADLNLNTHKITGLVDGVAATDAATVGQINALIAGVSDFKQPVRMVTTSTAPGNINLAAPGAITIDGVTPASGDRILVRNQTAGAENGIYVWNGTGSAMTRALDADTSAEMESGFGVNVSEGTVNADSMWMLSTNAPITLGTTSLAFSRLAVGGNTLARFQQTIGDGSTVSFTITHNLGSRDVEVAVREAGGSFRKVYPDVSMPTSNTVQLDFTVAPTTNQYSVAVLG